MQTLFIAAQKPALLESLSSTAKQLGMTVKSSSSVEGLSLSEASFIINCNPISPATARKVIQACLNSGSHYLDFADTRPEILSAITKTKTVSSCFAPALATHFVPFEHMARFLKQKLPIANRIFLAAREKTAYPEAPDSNGKPIKNSFERQVSFYGNVHLCQARDHEDYSSKYLSAALNLDIRLLDAMIPPEFQDAKFRYWGMVEEEKGFFRIQNLQSCSDENRGAYLAIEIMKKLSAAGAASRKGLVMPGEILGIEAYDAIPDTKWLTHEPLKLFELGIQKPD